MEFCFGSMQGLYCLKSRSINGCSLKLEYIIRADAPIPTLALHYKALTEIKKIYEALKPSDQF